MVGVRIGRGSSQVTMRTSESASANYAVVGVVEATSGGELSGGGISMG